MCVVMHDTLGEWHMPMSLHASRGNYDGVVHLELASLNQEMSVLLEVHNKLRYRAHNQLKPFMPCMYALTHEILLQVWNSTRMQSLLATPFGVSCGCD